MKTTKAFFFSLLFVLAAGTVSAQRGPDREPVDPAERAGQQTERLATVLDLTPEQTERVKAINLAFAEEVEGARKELRGEREAMRQAMETASAKRKTEVDAVLNAEQRAKLEKLEAQREARGGDKRPGGRKGGRSRG